MILMNNMKQLATIIAMVFLTAYAVMAEETVFYRIRLDSDINKASQHLVDLGLKKAAESGASYVILDLDTYGGAVDAADSIRTAILHSEVPVLAFINLQAASAGALISISCDSIYMRRGSSIGAATVVDQAGNVMPDKYQSFMRGMMRSTAEAKGRNPSVAEAMVDTAGVLSMTPEEAVEAGYCEGIYESVEEVAAAVASGEWEIRNMDMTFSEKVIHFFLNPILQAIFLMMIVGGIVIEIRTPGIGLPLVVAIIGSALYFAPLYIGNLLQNWELILFVIGLILIALELFVLPGFGVCGISGIIAVAVSLVFAMVDNDLLFNGDGSFDFTPVVKPLFLVSISSFTGVILAFWLVRRLYPTKSFDKIALRESLDGTEGFIGVPVDGRHLIGKEVEVFTDLKPSGKVISEGKVYEAVLSYGFASKGEKVKVVLAEQGRLYCVRQNG